MIYCFECTKCGNTTEVVRDADSRNNPVRCGSCKAHMERSLTREHGGFSNTPGNWPMESDAAGVHESQIADAEEHSRKVGIPTHFTLDGKAVFESRSHRRRYLRKIGLFDRSGGYSDPMPDNL